MRDQQQIENIIGQKITAATSLHGGMVGEVYRVQLENGDVVVAKVGDEHAALDIEGRMLQYLRDHSRLPVPDVLHSEAHLLLMSFVVGTSSLTRPVQSDVGHHIAALHSITAAQFGLEFDTLIGSLHQPNTPTDRWLDFFREQRLLYMADVAVESGNLPSEIRHRIDKMARKLDNILDEPAQPALIHGDLWTTNMLARNGKITAFVDPAIYYGHPEIELAFATLFGSLGSAFFRAYGEHHPIKAGFFEERREVYNLYPLLVHVTLFGGGYVQGVDEVLKQFGV